MTVECISIILIILAIFVVFLRNKRYDYAFSTVTLAILPFFHIAVSTVVREFFIDSSINTDSLTVTVDAVALVSSCILLGFLSQKIQSKRSRIAYLGSCGLFLVILFVLFITDTLK
ncbi:MAG: hypothetical protein K0R90_551 [Oscillospiraceae bacterium]|jgi:hypothetical protein|nr:hypothetical protein [Oscillospiraceae bacterium]